MPDAKRFEFLHLIPMSYMKKNVKKNNMKQTNIYFIPFMSYMVFETRNTIKFKLLKLIYVTAVPKMEL